MGPLSQLDAQSSFRLAQSRVQLQLDEKPTHGALWDFSQCLLAEVETLVLMAPTSTTNSQVKIKQMDASNATSTAKLGEFEKKGKGFPMQAPLTSHANTMFLLKDVVRAALASFSM